MQGLGWARCLVALVGLSACAAPATIGGAARGDVVERAEGFASRPVWADPDRPYQRAGDTLHSLGHVVIGPQDRVEGGYRIADSYARAALARLLVTRVSSLFRDVMATGDVERVAEVLASESRVVVDGLPIYQRYWERLLRQGTAEVHVYSRLDVRQSDVQALLDRALAGREDLRRAREAIAGNLGGRWASFVEVGATAQAQGVPAGLSQPPWAQGGDRDEPDQWVFVCHGVADSEARAQALAQAQCNEKMCQLFGLEIRARTEVTETLEKLELQHQVTQKCPDVRIVGRQTRYTGGECGPPGCVAWLLQTYPKPEYDKERARLAQPQVIEHHVVVQEGSEVYRDPAACRAALDAYGKVSDVTSTALEARSKFLHDAGRTCQGIDGRDSGLFTSLVNLLTQPLSSFLSESDEPGRNARWLFLHVDAAWRQSLDTQRFLVDRILSVAAVIEGALAPVRAAELYYDQVQDPAEVHARLQPLMQHPFVTAPASPHHLRSWHELIELWTSDRVADDPAYRDWLLAEASARPYECYGSGVSGRGILEYFGRDKRLDAAEWAVAKKLVRGSQGTQHICFSHMLRDLQMSPAEKAQRIAELLAMVEQGELHTPSQIDGFFALTFGFRDTERVDFFLAHAGAMQGPERDRRRAAEQVVGELAALPKEPERPAFCQKLVERLRAMQKLGAELRGKTYPYTVCGCLEPKYGLAGAARQRAIDFVVEDLPRSMCKYVPQEGR